MAVERCKSRNKLVAQYDARMNIHETHVISETKTQFTLIIDIYKKNTNYRVGTGCISGSAVKTQDGISIHKTSNYYFTNGDLITTIFGGNGMCTMDGFYTIPKVTEKIFCGEGKYKNFSGEFVVSVKVGTNNRVFSIYEYRE